MLSFKQIYLGYNYYNKRSNWRLNTCFTPLLLSPFKLTCLVRRSNFIHCKLDSPPQLVFYKHPKSKGFKSGDLAGHRTGLAYPSS